MQQADTNIKRFSPLRLIALWTVLFVLGGVGNLMGQTTYTVIFGTPGTNNWTIPLGVTSINITCIGGGGAGGGAGNSANTSGGGGGGGASVTVSNYSVTAGQQLSMIVGAGGTGVSNNTGNPGVASSATYNSNLFISAAGGAGGTKGNSTSTSNANGSTGGAGGSGGLIANNIPVNAGFKGGNGGNGFTGGQNHNNFSGAGGGGGGTINAGVNATNSTVSGVGSVGSGGTTYGGAGAASQNTGGNTGAVGTNAVATANTFGGGGGGATVWNSGSRAGGAGASGGIIITYTIPASVTILTWTSNGSWTVPANVCQVWVECWGAGGGGGGVSNTISASAGGGGGGAYTLNPNVTVTPGSSISYTVGIGGFGGTSTGGSGGPGGATTFSSPTAVTANGGNGGGGSTSGTTAGNGGAGGSGGTYSGGAGANGSPGLHSGGGGSVAGVGINGRVAIANIGGIGYSMTASGGTPYSVVGSGANGRTNLGLGATGSSPGGGGSGGMATSSVSSFAGGVGGNGRIVVMYSACPTPPCTAPTAHLINSNSPICQGSTLNLTGSAADATSYSWLGPNNFSSTTQNPSIANATPAASGTYFLTASNTCGSGSGLFDDFSDNNFTSNPVWTPQPSAGSTPTATTWTSGLAYLQGGNSYSDEIISTPSTQTYGSWKFDFQLVANVNANDAVRFHMLSSNASLYNSSGYYVRASAIGTVAGGNGIQLYRIDNGTSVSIGSAAYTANTSIRTIIVTRSTNNVFRVYLDGSSTPIITTAADGTYTTSSHAGVWTSGNNATTNHIVDNIICSSTLVDVTVNSLSVAPTSISGNNSICAGASTTLTSVNGSLGYEAEDLWYSGSCPTECYTQEWNTQPFALVNTNQVSLSNGILTVSSTSNDPMIDMAGLGPYNPASCRYINIRYRVTAGIASNVEIFFYNTTHNYAVGGETGFGNLISDNTWRTVSVDMWQDPEYQTGGNITGWRFDWAVADLVTMDIDFISLSSSPLVGTGTTLTVSPSSTTTYYTLKKGGCNTTTCASTTVTVNSSLTATITPASSTTICNGQNVVLNANTGSGFTYQWQLNGSNIPSATTASYTATASGTYTVIVTSSGCSATSAGTVVTVTGPVINPITGTTSISCGNTSTLSVSLNGTYGPTGGTISTSGTYTIHTFTSAGNLVVPAGFSTSADYLIVAGGGGGGGSASGNGGAGGGGAGGLLSGTTSLTAQTYPITIGTGGTAGVSGTKGGNGGNSIFNSLTATGGGGGGSYNNQAGATGGSGGGASYYSASGGTGTAGQGFNGGNTSSSNGAAGGGGAGGAAANNSSNNAGGAGGIGFLSSITGTASYYAGGGGGGGYSSNTGGAGGLGGGGTALSVPGNGVAGTNGLGGGGSGASGGGAYSGGIGGSGVVIIRYTSVQYTGTWTSSNTAVATVNSTTGVVTAVGPGTTTITYSLTYNGCSSSVSTNFTVSGPVINPISGTTTISCGQTTTLSATLSGTYGPTGGTITTTGAYTVHTFNSSGNLVVQPGFSAAAEYLIVAGGGGGGGTTGSNGGAGGGGAGGMRTGSTTLTAQTYPIVVGTGGTAGVSGTKGGNGGASSFNSVSATGGGGGGSNGTASGANGGSGGGASYYSAAAGTGIAGQGFNGGSTSSSNGGAGGGGAGGIGANAASYASTGGAGGVGLANSITGTSINYAGGGGGGGNNSNAGGSGGSGGGGSALNTPGNGNPGTDGLGGGGAGASGQGTYSGGKGGSGTVIIRYIYTPPTGTWSSNNTAVATVNSSTGVVTGVSDGTSTITYSFTYNGCTSTVSTIVTVSGCASITTGTVTGPLCEGSAVSVPFTATGTFNSGNVFTAELSNASGSFASPTSIGTLSSTSSGTIAATLPTGISGTGFLIRVVSSNPVIIGSSTAAFTIVSTPTTASAFSPTLSICGSLTSGSLAGNSPSSGTGSWSYVSGVTGSFSNAASPTSTFTANGYGTSVVRWTISNSPCAASSADVTLTFTPPIGFGNIQSPSSGSICVGGTFNVFGQVWINGITNPAGATTGLVAELGYNTSNSDPSTWINWQAATFNTQSGNNDEFISTLTGLTAGTYYYAYRYSYNGCTSYFGGLNGQWSSTSDNGILNVYSIPTITLNPASICNGATNVAVSATGASTYELFVNGVSQGAASTTNSWTVPGPLTTGNTVCVRGYPSTDLVMNGAITESFWGFPIATTASGLASSFGQDRLSALYVRNGFGFLNLAVAGNLVYGQDSKIFIFLDTKTGGYNSLSTWTNRSNTPNFAMRNLNGGTQFDAGFEPDYIVSVGTNGAGLSFLDLYEIATNTNTFIGNTTSNANLISFQANTGAGDYTKGYELRIPANLLGTLSSSIKLFGMLTNNPTSSNGTFLSNQFLTSANAGEGNFGDGAVNFGSATPNPITFTTSPECYTETCRTVSTPTTPTFTPIASICSGSPLSALPTTSTNGITGTWSPALNNTATTLYTFTPTAGQCAGTTTLTISIFANPSLIFLSPP